VNILGVAYFGDRIKIDGKVEISEDVLGGSGGENAEKLTGDWETLYEEKKVAFIAVVIHVFRTGDTNGGDLSQVMGCKLGCECKGTV